jgi:hypothetical protein
MILAFVCKNVYLESFEGLSKYSGHRVYLSVFAKRERGT